MRYAYGYYYTPRMGQDLSLSLSLSLSLYIYIYICSMLCVCALGDVDAWRSVSRVFPTMGKLREGGRFGARERVSGFAKEKLMLVPRLIGADFVRIEV